MRGPTDRGQAFTLEGFLGAMVVLMAILLALQAVVITPTTGGAVDRTVQAQLQQEARDALVVAEGDTGAGDLSRLLRYYDADDGEFHGAEQPIDVGDYNATDTGGLETMAVAGSLADLLNRRFTDQGWNYNLAFVYQEGGETQTRELVYQGQPNANAVAASYRVTLYDDQELLDDGGATTGTALADTATDEYFIEDQWSGGQPYAIVEVQLVVW